MERPKEIAMLSAPHPVATMTNRARWQQEELSVDIARERRLRIAAAAARPPRDRWWTRVRAGLRCHVTPVPVAAPSSLANR
jgi:hypothetical protein